MRKGENKQPLPNRNYITDPEKLKKNIRRAHLENGKKTIQGQLVKPKIKSKRKKKSDIGSSATSTNINKQPPYQYQAGNQHQIWKQMKFLSTMAVTKWVEMVTKQIITTWVVPRTNQIITIIKMVVNTRVVMVTKQTITTWVLLGFKKIMKQVIKLVTSVATWVMPGIGFVTVFTGETLVKIVATCIIYNMVKKWQTITNYSRHKQFQAWIMHIMTFFLGFQCTTVTPPIIYPHNNLSFTELYLMVPLLGWNIKMNTVQQYTFGRESAR